MPDNDPNEKPIRIKRTGVRPPTEDEINQGRNYFNQIVDAIPPKWRPVVAGIGGIIFLALGVLFVTNSAGPSTPNYTLGSCYVATAILAPSSDNLAHDVNIIVRDGQPSIAALVFDQSGHATMPFVQNCGPQGTPGPNQQIAPIMGWNVTFMADVFSGLRPLRYCSKERQDFDKAHGTQTAAIAQRAIRAVFDNTFEIKSSIENCSAADIVLGANAEQDCGSGAWGCAALGYVGSRPFVRITFNGPDLIAGTMRPDCIEFGIDWHELKHAGDLGHTGVYGGQSGPHGHPSDLGFIDGGTCHTVDNENSTTPAVQDWLAEDGHTFRYNAKLRGTNPDPTPAPTPTPTPKPTPAPTTVNTIYSWHQNASGGYDYLGATDVPRAPGGLCYVVAENGNWVGQVCYTSTSAIAPVGPVEPIAPR